MNSSFFQKRLTNHNWQRGQSIIEVSVAATAVVFVLVGVVSGLVLAVRNTTFSNYQSLATKSAQEAIESFRRFQVELGWESFYEIIANDGSEVTYCMSSVPQSASELNSLQNRICGATEYSDETKKFIREANIEVVSPNEISFDVRVRWVEGNREHVAVARQIFTNWQ